LDKVLALTSNKIPDVQPEWDARDEEPEAAGAIE